MSRLDRIGPIHSRCSQVCTTQTSVLIGGIRPACSPNTKCSPGYWSARQQSCMQYASRCKVAKTDCKVRKLQYRSRADALRNRPSILNDLLYKNGMDCMVWAKRWGLGPAVYYCASSPDFKNYLSIVLVPFFESREEGRAEIFLLTPVFTHC